MEPGSELLLQRGSSVLFTDSRHSGNSCRKARQTYLAESVCKLVLQKSIPAQNRQLILDIGNNEG